MSHPLIKLDKGCKIYRLGQEHLVVLSEMSFSLEDGDFAAIMGPSGSGKSTLLNIIGCLDRLTSGEYILDGEDVSKKPDSFLSTMRSQKIGFIFQQFNLIRHFTVLENVMMPFLYSVVDPKTGQEASLQAIEKVGLSHRMNHKPCELSGGEMQRVAIARAMAGSPKLILADEPTGNLDSKTGEMIMNLIGDLNESGTAILMVTHDLQVASKAKRTLTISDGHFL